MMNPAPLALVALLALSACVVPIAVPPPVADTCGAAGFASFVGQDESVLLATSFTTPIRIIRPGDVVTMDFSPTRANFEIGADGRVARVYCG